MKISFKRKPLQSLTKLYDHSKFHPFLIKTILMRISKKVYEMNQFCTIDLSTEYTKTDWISFSCQIIFWNHGVTSILGVHKIELREETFIHTFSYLYVCKKMLSTKNYGKLTLRVINGCYTEVWYSPGHI